jgi:hypothetical protein
MYCSAVTLVDEKLHPIGYSRHPKRSLSFQNALVENIATGCTIVMNRALRELLLLGTPENAGMHDSWTYLVASAFGKVVYDDQPSIAYRQHSGNLIGAPSGSMARWIRRIRRFIHGGGFPGRTWQAEDFRKIYGTLLPPEKRAILNRFLDDRRTFGGRLRYAVSGEVYRQSRVDDAILRLLVILNRV